MMKDRDSPRRGEFEPRDYYHNAQIRKVLEDARKRAWNKIKYGTVIAGLRLEQSEQLAKRKQKQWETSFNYKQSTAQSTSQSLEELIQIYK